MFCKDCSHFRSPQLGICRTLFAKKSAHCAKHAEKRRPCSSRRHLNLARADRGLWAATPQPSSLMSPLPTQAHLFYALLTRCVHGPMA